MLEDIMKRMEILILWWKENNMLLQRNLTKMNAGSAKKNHMFLYFGANQYKSR